MHAVSFKRFIRLKAYCTAWQCTSRVDVWRRPNMTSPKRCKPVNRSSQNRDRLNSKTLCSDALHRLQAPKFIWMKRARVQDEEIGSGFKFQVSEFNVTLKMNVKLFRIQNSRIRNAEQFHIGLRFYIENWNWKHENEPMSSIDSYYPEVYNQILFFNRSILMI
jgi:hypothetical protein